MQLLPFGGRFYAFDRSRLDERLKALRRRLIRHALLRTFRRHGLGGAHFLQRSLVALGGRHRSIPFVSRIRVSAGHLRDRLEHVFHARARDGRGIVSDRLGGRGRVAEFAAIASTAATAAASTTAPAFACAFPVAWLLPRLYVVALIGAVAALRALIGRIGGNLRAAFVPATAATATATTAAAVVALGRPVARFGVGVRLGIFQLNVFDLGPGPFGGRDGIGANASLQTGPFGARRQLAALKGEMAAAEDGVVCQDGDGNAEAALQITQMQALLVEDIERDLGAGSHREIVAGALDERVLERAQHM